MPWYWPFARGQAFARAPEAAAPLALAVGAEPVPSPDFSEFTRQTWAVGEVGLVQALWLASVAELGPYTPPEHVPLEVLDAMGWDPEIYLAERAALGPVLDPELYTVRHPDPAVRAAHEAALRPILAATLRALARAFTHGSSPVVFDWGAGPPGAPPVSYVRVYDLSPAEVGVRLEGDDVEEVIHGARRYGSDRAYVAVWDRSRGSLLGFGSRRRAYRAWFASTLVDLWHARYLERSVDVPRIGYAPDSKIKVGGQEIPAIRVLNGALMALRNGSACVLPSTRDASGEPAWRIEPLELPERDEVFHRALTVYAARKLQAALLPPGAAIEEFGGAGAKIADGLLKDQVQAIGDFLAEQLTAVVATVHRVNYGEASPLPTVVAADVPASRRRILLEILRATAQATQRLPDGREYTLAELVHPDILADLGVSARPVEEAAHEPRPVPVPFGGPPGRPIDTTGGRQERRDDARTEEGERDTGGRREDDMLRELAAVTERVAAGRLAPDVAAEAVRLAYPELDEGDVRRLLHRAALRADQPAPAPLALDALDAAEGRGAAGAFGVLTRLLRLQEERPPASIVVNVPEREVNIPITVEPAQVTVPVEVDARSGPVTIAEGAVRVDVAAPPAPPPAQVSVEVDARREPAQQRVTVSRDGQGRISGAEIAPE